MLDFTGERCVPWSPGQVQWPHVLRDHINRYAFALPYVAGRSVCDVGCGTGYGAWLMSMVAREVTGCDIAPDAIEFARKNFGKGGVVNANGAYFVEADVTNWVPPGAEVYTCFEVLEHVDDPQLILRNIPANATLIWSVPIDDPGRFHKRVYGHHEARVVVPGSEIYGQDENGAISRTVLSDLTNDAKYIIGVRGGEK